MHVLKLWHNDKTGDADVEVYGTDEGDLIGVRGDRNLWTDLWHGLPNPSPRAGHSQTKPLSTRVALDLRDVAQTRGLHAEVWRLSNEDGVEPTPVDDTQAPKITGGAPDDYDFFMAATQSQPGARSGRAAYLAGVIPPALEAAWLIEGAIPQTERPRIVLFDLGDFDPSPYAAEQVHRRLVNQGPLQLRYGERGVWGPDLVALARLFNAKPRGRIEYDPIKKSGDVVIFVVELCGVPSPSQFNLKIQKIEQGPKT